MKQVIIILGIPGSGKGTQCKMLEDKIGYRHLSMGDLLREVIAKDHDMSKQLKSFIDKGEMPPNEIVMNILEDSIKQYDNIILDGVPRNLEQSDILNRILSYNGYNIKAVIFLKLSIDKAIERLMNRYICNSCNSIFNKALEECNICAGDITKRADDIEEVIIKRIKTQGNIDEIIKQYNNPIIINADNNKEHIFDMIIDTLKVLP